METNKLYAAINEAIMELDKERLDELTAQAVAEKVNVMEAIEMAYTPAIRSIGEKFEEGEIFVPELIHAGMMIKEAISTLEEQLKTGQTAKKGKFLIGTVEGDIHDIGKDLVSTMLATRGIEVIDIGVDCPAVKFIDAAVENDVDIIGASCLLTTTALELVKIVDLLKERQLRERFYFVVGGAAVEEEWAKSIGTDGSAGDLQEAVKLALSLLGKKEGGA